MGIAFANPLQVMKLRKINQCTLIVLCAFKTVENTYAIFLCESMKKSIFYMNVYPA